VTVSDYCHHTLIINETSPFPCRKNIIDCVRNERVAKDKSSGLTLINFMVHQLSIESFGALLINKWHAIC
jgi:hypothetical protein